MIKNYFQSHKKNLLFLIGLVVFTGLNTFSALTMELHFDEAYYWFYSRYPAMGYFDHPPMISWLIFIGTHLFDNEFGVRLLAIMLSTTAMVFLWKMVKIYSSNALLFWSLVYSIILIQPYCFISTPDAPLLAFSILFFYFFRRYLDRSSFQNVVLVAFCLALMLYSKYHGVLVVLFVVIANYKLVKKPTFWIIAALTLIYFLPHIIWQIDHRFPSILYHLVDSHKTAYKPAVTLNFLLSMLVLTGPWLGWLFLFILIGSKPENNWEKSLKYTGVGFLVFFFLATFAGDFEAHWILLATIPLFVLSYKVVAHNKKWQKWVKISGAVSFIILLVMRLFILLPVAGNIAPLKLFMGNRPEVLKIKEFAGETPVVFQDNWIEAATYAWYTRDKKTACLNSALYRKTQFDLIDFDEELTGQTVYVLTTDSAQFQKSVIVKNKRTVFYAEKIEGFRSYYNIEVKHPVFTPAGRKLIYKAEIINPYTDTVKLGKLFETNAGFQLYLKRDRNWEQVARSGIDSLVIPPKATVKVQGHFNNYEDLDAKEELYFVLKIGELKPVPGRFKVKVKE